jgi:hypothetical protein
MKKPTSNTGNIMDDPAKKTRIVPRQNQTPKDDTKSVTKPFGDVDDVDAEVGRRLEKTARWVQEALDGALNYFWRTKSVLQRVPLKALTTQDKCHVLEEIIIMLDSEEHCRERLFGDLCSLRHADEWRAEVLRQECRGPGSISYTTFAELARHLEACAEELCTSMYCEYDDYESSEPEEPVPGGHRPGARPVL